MKRIEIESGTVFHYWTVLSRSKKTTSSGDSYFNCKCKCGTLRDVSGHSLRIGGTKSCGCYVKEVMSKIKRIDITNKRFGKLIALNRVISKNGHYNNWNCICDCGKEVVVSTGTLNRGKQNSCGCVRKGESSHNWKGGRIKTNGYILKHSPNHPKANTCGYVKEHRLVMEEKIGRILLSTEEVHHKNGIRDDNNISNLELWTKSHPKGQRVEDMIEFCESFLKIYKPNILKKTTLKK